MSGIVPQLCSLAIAASFIVLGGCSSARKAPESRKVKVSHERLDTAMIEHQVSAAALVFDPPIAEYSAAVPFRDGRQPTAFIGYDSVISTYFYVRVDDRQRYITDDGIGRYERRAVSERFGVSQR